MTYTRDQCDNWSCACTIFECATGRLPFLTAKGIFACFVFGESETKVFQKVLLESIQNFSGPHDFAGMYNMMLERPPDIVCGHTDPGTGEYVWSKELPHGGCGYPRLAMVFFSRSNLSVGLVRSVKLSGVPITFSRMAKSNIFWMTKTCCYSREEFSPFD